MNASPTGVEALQDTRALRNVISRLAPGLDVDYVMNGNLDQLNSETRELILNYYRHRLLPDLKALRRG